jgi:hypothetical protein
MKTIGSPTLLLFSLVFTAGIIYFFSISGCKDILTNTTGENVFQARSEQEFATNRELRAVPGAVIAVQLEYLNSPQNDSLRDTGPIGEDIIPIRFTENSHCTIQFASSAYFDVFLVNSETGAYIYYLYPGATYADVDIPAGDYLMHFKTYTDYSTDSANAKQIIFVQPSANTTGNNSSPNNFNIVISNSGCIDCDLSGVNLQNMMLNGMNLNGAKLNKANLSHTNLNNAHLNRVNLNEAYFYQSLIMSADLSNSSLKGAALRNSDLRFSNLSSSDLTNGDIRFSDIRSANFCGSTLTGIITNGVVYDENTQCWP